MVTIEEFKNEVWDFAQTIGVSPKEIQFRSMTTKLASCSSKGRLTFDNTLLSEPEEKRYEAIVHELLHLRYPDHGKMFYLMLNIYLQKNESIRSTKKIK